MEEGPVYQQVMHQEQRQFKYGAGCSFCARTGFYGRTGIFELLETSGAVQELVLRNASAGEIRQQCEANGMVTMLQDGMQKAQQGITTPAEVMRNCFTLSNGTSPTEAERSLSE